MKERPGYRDGRIASEEIRQVERRAALVVEGGLAFVGLGVVALILLMLFTPGVEAFVSVAAGLLGVLFLAVSILILLTTGGSGR